MERIELKYNGLHTALLRMPGHYAKTARGAIIKPSKAVYENELKDMVNANGEKLYIPVVAEEEKPKKKASKKE